MIKELFQKGCPVAFYILIVCALALLNGCGNDSGSSNQSYNLDKPEEMVLGKVLNEISGITYNPKDNSLVAIADNKKKIFNIILRTKKLKDLTGDVVGPDSDLEDIVLLDSGYYLLSSWGEIRWVKNGSKDSSEVVHFNLGLEGQNDFESLYFDSTAGGLIMMCKTCAHEKGQAIRTAYRFDLESQRFDSLPFFAVTRAAVEELAKDRDAKFDPAAAAIHPIEKKLYILSSSGNLLVVTDLRGKLEAVHKLNPDKFPQSEGIAFAPNGDMYISNEGKMGKPTLLYFRYKARTKSKAQAK